MRFDCPSAGQRHPQPELRHLARTDRSDVTPTHRTLPSGSLPHAVREPDTTWLLAAVQARDNSLAVAQRITIAIHCLRTKKLSLVLKASARCTENANTGQAAVARWLLAFLPATCYCLCELDLNARSLPFAACSLVRSSVGAATNATAAQCSRKQQLLPLGTYNNNTPQWAP